MKSHREVPKYDVRAAIGISPLTRGRGPSQNESSSRPAHGNGTNARRIRLEALALRRQGVPVRAIALQLGVSRTYIYMLAPSRDV